MPRLESWKARVRVPQLGERIAYLTLLGRWRAEIRAGRQAEMAVASARRLTCRTAQQRARTARGSRSKKAEMTSMLPTRYRQKP